MKKRIPSFLLCTLMSVMPVKATAGEYESDILEAARGGDAKSQFGLALLYEYGGETIPRNPKQAIVWLEKAGNSGVAGACLYLGLKYEHGNTVKQDFSRAVCWYTCAAQQDWPMAQFFLAGLHEKGKGVPVSTLLSLAWFGLAAEHEYPGAAEEYTRLIKATGFRDLVKLRAKQEGLLREERRPCN